MSRKAIQLIAAAAVTAAMFHAGCSRNAGPPNFLLISVDTLRPDHLGSYGYHRDTSPRIDEFFGRGTVYEYANSTEANTTPSVVSFLSGMLPQETGVRLLYQKVPEDLPLVSDYLHDAGYQTAGIVSNMVLTVEASDLDRHFDYYDDYVDDIAVEGVFERIAGPTTQAAAEWMVKSHDSERPYFLWVHYQDPHGPYTPPLDAPKDFTHETPKPISLLKLQEYMRIPGVDDGLEYVDRYDEEIAYMDAQVGRLLDLLDEQDMLDNTVVIFTADHGETMMEHEHWFTHGYHVYEAITRVPLMIRLPRQKSGARVETRVSLVDIVPTMLSLAGLTPANELRGQVLDDTVELRPVYMQGNFWRAMVYDQQKWVSMVRKDGQPVPRCYFNLADDPAEKHCTHWVANEHLAAFNALVAGDPDPRGIPEEFAEGMVIEAPKVRPGLDEETLKKLKSLGYVN